MIQVLYKKIEFSSMNKTLYIDNFAFWEQSDEEKLPDVSFIPPLLRRRMSDLEKIAIYLANKTAPKDRQYRTVFASRFGEWEQTIKLIKQFFNDGEMSPAGFSNSVHNASVGHLSLITKNHADYTAIASGQDTIENAIIDATTGKMPVLFIYAEEKAPIEYEHMFDTPVKSHGFAIFIDNNGAKAFDFVPCKKECNSLNFNQLRDFFNGKTHEINTTHWTIVRKK